MDIVILLLIKKELMNFLLRVKRYFRESQTLANKVKLMALLRV